MATKKGSSKKSTKKAAKKSSKKTSKKSTKRLALTTSPGTGGVSAGFPFPNLRCIEACADVFARCLKGGGKPAQCQKAFMACLQRCLRGGGIGGVGGVVEE